MSQENFQDDIHEYMTQLFKENMIHHGQAGSVFRSLMDLYQLDRPDLEKIESNLDLPLTGDLNQMTLNYSQKFYTRNCLMYHQPLQLCWQGAVQHNHSEIIDHLLQDLSSTDMKIYLKSVVEYDNLEVLTKMLTKYPPTTNIFWFLFRIAMKKPSVQIRDYILNNFLLQSSLRINYALSEAGTFSRIDYEIIRKLILAGGKCWVNILKRLIHQRDLENLNKILEILATNPDVDLDGMIKDAIITEDPEIFKILTQKIKIKNEYDIAAEVVDLGENPVVVDFLDKVNLDMAMSIAIHRRNQYIIPLLIQAGAKIPGK